MKSQVFATCRLCARERRPDLGLQLSAELPFEALRVCDEHTAKARLVNGAWLAPLLARAPGIDDAPGMAFLFNPVRIDGVTAWVAWQSSTWRVYLPLERCADAFEHEVLHRPEHVETLWLLHQARASFGDAPTAIDLARWSRPSGWQRFEAVQLLCDLWWRRQTYGAALRERGTACAATVAEAMAITRALEPCVTPIDRIGEALRCLLALGERRFGPVLAQDGDADRASRTGA